MKKRNTGTRHQLALARDILVSQLTNGDERTQENTALEVINDAITERVKEAETHAVLLTSDLSNHARDRAQMLTPNALESIATRLGKLTRAIADMTQLANTAQAARDADLEAIQAEAAR